MANEYCRSCGMTWQPGSSFCTHCGASVPVQEASGEGSGTMEGETYQADSAYSQPQSSPPVYAQAAPGYAYSQTPAPVTDDSAPLSTGQFILMMLISAIPMVGFIMQLVWAFGGTANINRRNYARAVLILSLVGIVLAILFSGMLIAFVSIVSNSMRSQA